MYYLQNSTGLIPNKFRRNLIQMLAIPLLATCLLMSYARAEAPLIDLASELEQIKEKEKSSAVRPSQPKQAPVQTPSHTQSETKKIAEKTSDSSNDGHNGAHWSYSGKEGPDHWGSLSEEFALCSEGRNQSPVDLREQMAVGAQGLPELDIRYRDVPLKIINNGHTVQVKYPLGSYIKIGGKRYELLQYHFHTPSEHKKEGFNYPMEVHLVHSDGDGNLAVIGILFQEGEANPHIDKLLGYIPKEKNKLQLHENDSLNPVNFLPGNTEFYKYSGSLTTPPCSEGVYWMVFKQPVEASARQLMQMNEVMGENARPVQDINSRALLKSWLEVQQDNQFYEFY